MRPPRPRNGWRHDLQRGSDGSRWKSRRSERGFSTPIIRPGAFPLSADLVQGPALGQSDGYMYAIIRAGRGLMPSYGARIAHHERWAIVNYMRALQGGGTAPTVTDAILHLGYLNPNYFAGGSTKNGR
jgi:hypothetical protein